MTWNEAKQIDICRDNAFEHLGKKQLVGGWRRKVLVEVCETWE